MKRVVITGQGTINALGGDVAETTNAFQNAHSAIGPLDIPDIDRLSVKIGAAVQDFEGKDHFSPRELSLYDRFTQFALFAAREAINQSALDFGGDIGTYAGVILGTAGGGLNTQNNTYKAVFEEGKNRVHPFVVPQLMHNAASSHLSIKWGLKGPVYTVSTACAASNHAMGQAFHLIRSGAAPVMVTGGSESMLCFGGIKAWEGLRVLSPDGCRPFSGNRNGMVQGEGAAIFVFEELEHAKARGANILAEVSGFAMNSDASDIVLPSRDGAARAMQAALSDAGMSVEDIDYINAHGTGTKANDKTETGAIKDVFGGDASRVMVSSTKSMHGHLIGATGAVELLASIMAVKDGIIAPTVGYECADPDCDLDYVPNKARHAKVRAAISNAFAFGGLNAVLVLRAF